MQNLFQVLCDHNGILHRLAGLSGETRHIIPELRENEESVIMTGSGLAVIGYLWYLVRKEQAMNAMLDANEMLHRIAVLDWRNSSYLFSDNLKINPERTQTGQKYVKAAGNKIWEMIRDTNVPFAA
jgi:hypothetical protein